MESKSQNKRGKASPIRWVRIAILTLGLFFIPLLRHVQADEPVIPLIDLGTGNYLGFEGGLYPNAMNDLPPLHAAEGTDRTLEIQPLDTNGIPDPEGKFILLSVGMSNANQEFCGNSTDGVSCFSWTFMGQAVADPLVEPTTMRIVNGAKGGQVANLWDSPTDANYDRIRDEILAPLGLSENQVQIVWAKMANALPDISLPASNADAYVLLSELGDIVRALKVRYPNLQQIFFSSRIYAGYANTLLNPEPYAYESGFAVKWLIEAQINQMNGGDIDPAAGDLDYTTVAPWLAWGSYLWADGLNPRSDGLIWELADFEADGTHPSQIGETKVGARLLDFFLNSPQTSCWFRADQVCGGPTPTPTNTPTPTDTPTPTATYTPTETPNLTETATPMATDTPTPTATNTPPPTSNEMHIASIAMSVVPAGTNRFRAQAVVTVVDANTQPVSGATVTGSFTGDSSGSASGVTNASGQVTLLSPVKQNGANWTFCLTNVTKTGWTYNPLANVETCDSTGTGPTATPTQTLTPTPTATPGSSTSMHIGDLDGASVSIGNGWNATVTMTVHDASHNPVAGALVTGSWSSGATGSGTCTTDTSGQCSIAKVNLRNTSNSVTFTVTNVTHSSLTYHPVANHDPDGDSNGTTILIAKP